MLRVAGASGSGLSGKCVHGTEELICDAAGLSKTTEECPVNCSRIVSDGVLTSEEETRDRLQKKKKKKRFEISFKMFHR